MPVPLSCLEKTAFLRSLLMAPPGVGKTTVALCTAPRPVRVFVCEDDSALQYAYVTLQEEGLSNEEIDAAISIERITGSASMVTALNAARNDAVAGKLKTVVVDPFSDYDMMVLEECEKRNAHGQAAHGACSNMLRHVVTQLKRLPCHLIVVTHFNNVPGSKTQAGDGRVPNMANSRNCIYLASQMHQRLWLELDENGKREFLTAPKGAWGPSVRGLKSGIEHLPANFTELASKLGMKTVLEDLTTVAQHAAATPSPSPKTVVTPIVKQQTR